MPSTTFSLSVPMLPLQVSLLWHFAFFVFGFTAPWITFAYLVSNMLMLMAGAWATIDREKASTALFFFVAILINQLHEIVFFALYFKYTQEYDSTSEQKFSAGMAIISHITKYVTVVFVFQHFMARGGSLSESFQSFRQYEPIGGSVTSDGGHAGGYDHTSGGYDHTSGYSQYNNDSQKS